jgi:hypothetical protein
LCPLLIGIVDVVVLPAFPECCSSIPFLASDVSGDGRSLPVATSRWSSGRRRITLFVDQHDHPDAYSAGMSHQWCAVNPSEPAVAFAIRIGSCEPADFGGDSAAVGEGLD